jgi:hypothetical protein
MNNMFEEVGVRLPYVYLDDDIRYNIVKLNENLSNAYKNLKNSTFHNEKFDINLYHNFKYSYNYCEYDDDEIVVYNQVLLKNSNEFAKIEVSDKNNYSLETFNLKLDGYYYANLSNQSILILNFNMFGLVKYQIFEVKYFERNSEKFNQDVFEFKNKVGFCGELNNSFFEINKDELKFRFKTEHLEEELNDFDFFIGIEFNGVISSNKLELEIQNVYYDQNLKKRKTEKSGINRLEMKFVKYHEKTYDF